MNILNFISLLTRNLNFVLIVLTFGFLSCKKTEVIDNNIKEPILLKTKSVEILGLNILKFTGVITKLNKEEITDIGFIVYDKSPEARSPVEIVIPKKDVKSGLLEIEYIHKFSSNFVLNKPYSYCFFVKTNKALYKGEVIDFVVDLIKLNEDTDIYLKIGDTLTLKGDFSQMDADYFINTDSQNNSRRLLKHEISDDKKQLKINIPTTSLEHGQVMDLILNYKSKNELNYFSRKLATIKLIASVKEPLQTSFHYNDLLPIEGLGLPVYTSSDKFKVIINGVSKPYHRELRFSDFDSYTNTSFKWAIDYGHEVVEFKKNITFKAPSVEDLIVEDKQIHPSQNFSLKGLNFKSFFKNTVEVSLNNINVDYKYMNDSILYINSSKLPHGEYTVRLKSPLYSVTSKSKLIIKPMKVTGISKSIGYGNDDLKIFGDFIIGQNYLVSFPGAESIWVHAKSTSELYVKTPHLNTGKYNLIFSWNDFNGQAIDLDALQVIDILDSRVNEILSPSFSPGQTITVTGEGLFDIMFLYLGNYSMEAETVSQNKVTFKIPFNIPPGKYEASFFRKWRNELKTNQIIEIK